MLANITAKNAKPKEKPYKLSDSQGLYLLVKPNGSKLWNMKYRANGKERKLSFGPYPEVSITEARQARDAARASLREGIDPSLKKKQQKAEAVRDNTSFKNVTEQWILHTAPSWKSAKHQQDVIRSLERFVFPSLGNVPLDAITAPMVLIVLQKIESTRAIETAHRVCQRISSIFSYGIACGYAPADPAAHLKSVLKKVPKGRQPAIVDPTKLKKMLWDIDSIPAYPAALLALRFLALTAVRSGEVRGMRWDEIEGSLWIIPAERMKMKRPHIVPLSRQALNILEAIRPLTGKSQLVFASPRSDDKQMSDMTLSVLLKRAGYGGKHVPHGFRSSFSSIMNERRPSDRNIIDLMLAHVSKDKIEAAYNRAVYLDTRKDIAQEWADLILDGAKKPSDLMFSKKR